MSDPRDHLFDDKPPTGEPPIPGKAFRLEGTAPGMCTCIRYEHACINNMDQEDGLCTDCRPRCGGGGKRNGKCYGSCVAPQCSLKQHQPRFPPSVPGSRAWFQAKGVDPDTGEAAVSRLFGCLRDVAKDFTDRMAE
jgi:hypothetical protein